MTRKRNLIVALAAATVLALAAVIGVAAQSSDKPSQDDYINKLAGNLGVSSDQLKTALQQTSTQMIDEAVAAGRITQEQADQLKQRLANGEGLLRPHIGGPDGEGRHMRGGRPGKGMPFGNVGNMIQDAAAIFGVDAQTLLSELRDGKTLAQVGEEHGKSKDQLKTELTAKSTEQLNQLVTDGKITAEQRDKMLEQLSANIDKALDSSLPMPKAHGPRQAQPAGTPSA